MKKHISVGTMLLTSALAATAQQLTPVATGLNNPRGLAFAPNGDLYVAEAGIGAGDGNGGFGTGVGLTGAIDKIRNVQSSQPLCAKVITGLASLGTAERGPEVVGADGISLQGAGNLYVIMAESSAGVQEENPALDPMLLKQFGRLLNFAPNGNCKSAVDVGGFNFAWTGAHQNDPWAPQGQFPDSNPYGVLACQGRQYVVDAGANTVSEISANGTLRLIAYLPDPLFPNPGPVGPPLIPISDAVPTCIAQGPDGFLYVGTLAFGANFARHPGPGGPPPPPWTTLPKQSKVYRIDPKSTKFFLTDADVWADNLDPITGCGFGPDGSLYVTEFFTESSGYSSGDVLRIHRNPDGTAGARTALGVGGLQFPNGFACGPDGAIYVSNNSTSTAIDPTPGEVVRVNF